MHERCLFIFLLQYLFISMLCVKILCDVRLKVVKKDPKIIFELFYLDLVSPWSTRLLSIVLCSLLLSSTEKLCFRLVAQNRNTWKQQGASKIMALYTSCLASVIILGVTPSKITSLPSVLKKGGWSSNYSCSKKAKFRL